MLQTKAGAEGSHLESQLTARAKLSARVNLGAESTSQDSRLPYHFGGWSG